MKKPVLQSDAFLADVARVRSAPRPSGATPPPVHLWWLGQSGFLVHAAGRCLLLDPYLSDSLTRKYAQTDKPHVRLTEPVIEPERLEGVAVVTSSHNHTDHLDPETLRPLAGANPAVVLVGPEANRTTLRERSGLPDDRILGLSCAIPTPGAPASATSVADAPGSAVEVAGFRITAVPAAHEGLDLDSAGRPVYLGFVVEVGGCRIYHSGDTVRYPGMEEVLRPWRVDVALLPINGRAPERRVAGNLWGREAAELAQAIGARLVIPCHYDLFEFNTATPDEFVATCRQLNQPAIVLRQGGGIPIPLAP